MIPKGISKWPIEITSDTLPLNYGKPTHAALNLDLSIAPSNNLKNEFHIEVIIFCHVFAGAFNLNPPPDYFSNQLFEFTTSSKFKFFDSLVEEATIQFIHNCMLSAISDFNELISNNPSQLIKQSDDPKKNIQFPNIELDNNKPFILKIWKLGNHAN